MTQDPPISGGRQHSFNPVQAWASSIDHTSLMTPQDVLDAVDQTIGVLSHAGEGAARLERSLAGRIARFMQFPFRVREAARTNHADDVQANVAFAGGVLAQIAVGVAVGLIVHTIISAFE